MRPKKLSPSEQLEWHVKLLELNGNCGCCELHIRGKIYRHNCGEIHDEIAPRGRVTDWLREQHNCSRQSDWPEDSPEERTPARQ